MTEVIKIIGLIIFSGLKFFFAPSTIYLSGYSYFETIGITITGGVLSVLTFFYFGEVMKYIFSSKRKKKKEKKKFTKMNRTVIKVKAKYGLVGLALLTPCFFSVPLGSLLAARYFDKDKRTIPFLFASVVLWSFILTSISTFFG